MHHVVNNHDNEPPAPGSCYWVIEKLADDILGGRLVSMWTTTNSMPHNLTDRASLSLTL
jgi:hypothetical protein